MSKDILHAFKHYGVTPDSVKRAEGVLADNGIDRDEVQTVLQAVGYALLDCELYPAPVCLQRAGIIPRDPDEKVVYAGHEMTYAQSEELSDLVREFWEWFDFHTDAFTLEEDYEKETGASCVWWIAEGSLEGAKCYLPRPTEYETEGFTDEFVNWLDEKVIQAYFKGKKTVKSLIDALKIKKGKK